MKPVLKNHFQLPYQDRVYGPFGKEDFDGFALRIIETENFRRLEKVYQHGPDLFWDPNLNGTRAEHCLGVYFLLKKLGTSPEERLAGLVHDFSHTAFSHVADFVFGNHADHTYAEDFELEFLRDPEVAQVLEAFGFAAKQLVKNPGHTLLEKPAPDLCADRVDYLYRDLLMKGLITPGKVRQNFEQLTVANGEIVFKNQAAARFFGEHYLLASEKIFYLPRSIFAYQMLGDAVRIGLEKGYLSQADFFSTDDRVWSLLKQSGDQKVLAQLTLITDVTQVRFSSKPGKGWRLLQSKPRAVDPKFFNKGRLVKLSAVDKVYAKKMAASLAWQKKGFFVRVLKSET